MPPADGRQIEVNQFLAKRLRLILTIIGCVAFTVLAQVESCSGYKDVSDYAREYVIILCSVFLLLIGVWRARLWGTVCFCAFLGWISIMVSRYGVTLDAPEQWLWIIVDVIIVGHVSFRILEGVRRSGRGQRHL